VASVQGRRGACHALATLAIAAALAGCGSAGVGELPPAAEPGRAPVPTAAPAGRVVAVGPAPEAVAVDPATGRVAVGLRRASQLALVDGRSGRVVRRIGLPAAPRHLAPAESGAAVLVPAERADRLLVVGFADGAILQDIVVGDFPHDATAASGRVFVGDEAANTMSVLRHGRREARVRVATQPGGLTGAGGGRFVAVVSVRERVLELFDARTLRRVGRAPAGVGPTHVAPGGDAWLYVTDTRGGALLVYRIAPELELVRRLHLPGAPYGIAADAVRKRLWITLTARNEVVELPAHGRPHVLRRLPTVRQPNGVAVDPRSGRVFVSGLTDGVLQLIDPP
jgi:DNA-binding beta-propeller fold protein YncE/predicted small lipoprotein YifL